MFNKKSLKKNRYMLDGSFAKRGYDWWWHSFTGKNKVTGKERHFFIEFFIINPKLSPDKVVLGQAKENIENKNRPCYLMVKCGSWGENKKQLHKFFPLNEVQITKCPIEIKVGDFYLSETRLDGKVEVNEKVDGEMSDTGSMEFHLDINKEIAFNVGYGTSGLFTFLKAFEMYWHAQGMKSMFEGTIKIDGSEYVVASEDSYGYSDKNWGRAFTSPWVWLSSCHIVDAKTKKEVKHSVFDIGGGRPKAFGIPFKRKLLGAYYLEGKEYEMNFSKFYHPSKTEFSFDKDKTTVYWKVTQQDRKYMIITKVTCERKDMLFVNYEEPSGQKRYSKLYNGGNGKGTLNLYKFDKHKKDYVLIKEYLIDHVGCEYGEFDKN